MTAPPQSAQPDYAGPALVVAFRVADSSTPWQTPTNRTYPNPERAAHAALNWVEATMRELGVPFNPRRDMGGTHHYLAERINQPIPVRHPGTGEPLLQVILATIAVPALTEDNT